jgi:hypothetical protein
MWRRALRIYKALEGFYGCRRALHGSAGELGGLYGPARELYGPARELGRLYECGGELHGFARELYAPAGSILLLQPKDASHRL